MNLHFSLKDHLSLSYSVALECNLSWGKYILTTVMQYWFIIGHPRHVIISSNVTFRWLQPWGGLRVWSLDFWVNLSKWMFRTCRPHVPLKSSRLYSRKFNFRPWKYGPSKIPIKNIVGYNKGFSPFVKFFFFSLQIIRILTWYFSKFFS